MSQPASRPVARHAVAAGLIAAAVAALTVAAPARAADPHAAPAKAAPAPKAVAATATDPMDTLREKLATKLGAMKAPEAPSPYVMRVVSKSGDPAPGTAAAQVAANAAGHGAAKADAHGSTPAKIAKLRAAKAAAGHKPDGHAAHWSYAGSGGPETWGQLKPEFSTCASGSRQSPIDIRSGVKVDLEPIQFDYRPSGFSVIDNGHTIQVNVAGGNAIEVQGRRFDLVQFHFHRPAEERINGRQYDMSVHLVHKDAEGRLAVVGLLLERGAPQPVVQRVWNDLPLEKGYEQPGGQPIDLNALLPPDRGYYTYMGSLTTPPCNEGVLWMVMREPVPVSQAQIDIFSHLYPMNARPLQSAAGRLIKQSQ